MYEKNLWRLILNDGILEAMTLLGCEERYIEGRASDFEAFREWIDAYPYMSGNKTAVQTAEKIGGLIGKDFTYSDLCGADASLLWNCQCGNISRCNSDEKLYLSSKPDRVLSCAEKEKIMSPFVNLSDLLPMADTGNCKNIDEFERYIENIGIIQFGMKSTGNRFIRPDRYHCDKYYSQYIGGEKSKNDFISSQILLDMIYHKKCEIIHLIVEDKIGIEWVNEFIKYLSFREIKVKTAVHFYESVTPEQVKETCLLNRNVIPVLPIDDEEYINSFAEIIPRGIIVF